MEISQVPPDFVSRSGSVSSEGYERRLAVLCPGCAGGFRSSHLDF